MTLDFSPGMWSLSSHWSSTFLSHEIERERERKMCVCVRNFVGDWSTSFSPPLWENSPFALAPSSSNAYFIRSCSCFFLCCSYYKQILTSLWLLLMGLTLLGAGFVLLFTNERKSHCTSNRPSLLFSSLLRALLGVLHPSSLSYLLLTWEFLFTLLLPCSSIGVFGWIIRAGLLCAWFNFIYPWSIPLQDRVLIRSKEAGLHFFSLGTLLRTYTLCICAPFWAVCCHGICGLFFFHWPVYLFTTTNLFVVPFV